MCPKECKKLMKEHEGIFHQKWLRMQGLSILDKRRLLNDLIALFKFLGRGSGEESVDCFTLIPSDRTCGNHSKLLQKRFRLDLARE